MIGRDRGVIRVETAVALSGAGAMGAALETGS